MVELKSRISGTRHPDFSGPDGKTADARPLPFMPLLRLASFLRPYTGRVMLAGLALLLAALVTLMLPLALRDAIDSGFTGITQGGSGAGILPGGGISALFLLVSALALLSALRYYCVVSLGEYVVADLRHAFFSRLISLDIGFFDRARSGDMISRLAADTTQIKSALGTGASIAMRNLVMFAGATMMMIVTDPYISAIALCGIIALVVPLAGFGRLVRGKSRATQDRLAEASAHANEVFIAIRFIQAYCHEKIALQRFARDISETRIAALGTIRARAFLTGCIIFFVGAGIVGVLWVGARDVMAGRMTAGELSQFLLYAVLAAGALAELSQIWGELALAAGAAERILDFLERRPAIAEPAAPRALPAHHPVAIRFEKVHFQYQETARSGAICGIDLMVRAGEQVAIVGPTGAGKSTLLKLLIRQYDAACGTITINGVDMRALRPHDVRALIAYVPQESVIFSATLRENIRYGNWQADHARIEAAAKAARAHDFISRMPQGYDTRAGERGVTLSGGQRQKIALARAILKDAPILLMDEATNALDAQNEADIKASLDSHIAGRTSIVVSHRLSTVRDAQKIIVIDRGRIIETGTHDTLVARGGLYARLATLQLHEWDSDRPPESTGSVINMSAATRPASGPVPATRRSPAADNERA